MQHAKHLCGMSGVEAAEIQRLRLETEVESPVTFG